MENNKVKNFFCFNSMICKSKILRFLFFLMILMPLNQVTIYEIQANDPYYTPERVAERVAEMRAREANRQYPKVKPLLLKHEALEAKINSIRRGPVGMKNVFFQSQRYKSQISNKANEFEKFERDPNNNPAPTDTELHEFKRNLTNWEIDLNRLQKSLDVYNVLAEKSFKLADKMAFIEEKRKKYFDIRGSRVDKLPQGWMGGKEPRDITEFLSEKSKTILREMDTVKYVANDLQKIVEGAKNKMKSISKRAKNKTLKIVERK